MLKKGLLGFVFVLLLLFIGVEVYLVSYRVTDPVRAGALESASLKRIAERNKRAENADTNGFPDLQPTLEKTSPSALLKPYRAFTNYNYASTGENKSDVLVVYSTKKAEIDDAAREFETIVPTLRTIFAKPDFLWHTDVELGTMSKLPNFIQLRAIAQNLVGYAEYLEVSGHPDQALNAYLWDLEFGARISQNDGLLSLMIGVAIESIGVDAMLDFIGRHPRLSAQDYRNALQRIDAIVPAQKLLLDRIDEEYVLESQTLDLLGDKPGILNGSTQAVGFGEILVFRFPGFVPREKRVLTNSFLLQREGIEKRTAVDLFDKLPRLSIVPIFVSNFARAGAQFNLMLTKINGARVEMALELYKSEKGSYPDRLDSLVPGLMKTLPASEVSADGKFTYARTHDGYTLISSFGPYFQQLISYIPRVDFMPRPPRK